MTRLTYDGTVYATNGVFSGSVTTGSGSSIGGGYITSTSVPSAALVTTVQNNITNGVTAYDYTSDISGSTIKDRRVSAKTGNFTNLYVGNTLYYTDVGGMQAVVWKTINGVPVLSHN